MPNLETDLARAMGPKVSADMNGALCAFAMRWELDGDYIRCRKCTSPQLTTYSDRAFLHHPGCKAAGTVETHPWRTYLELLAPLIAAWSTRAASGGDSASLDQRAPDFGPIERDERMDRTYIPMPGGWEIQTKGKGSTFRICDPQGERLPIPESPYLHETLERMAREVHAAARTAITAALANQQGVAAKREAMINLLTATADEIGEKAKRTGESRFPSPEQLRGWETAVRSVIKAIATQPAGDVGSEST